MFDAPQTPHLLAQEDAVEGGEETPAGLDLLLLLVEGHVGVAALHGAVCGLSHQLPPPLLLGDEGGVTDGGQGIGDGDEGEEVLGGQSMGQLPVSQGGEVLGGTGCGSVASTRSGAPRWQQQGHRSRLGDQTET